MNIHQIKEQFEIFKCRPNLAYLDTAASALKPQSVIDAEMRYYSRCGANVSRGLYDLSICATEEYENSRSITAHFIGAERDEIVFTSGATMSLNMIAYGLANRLSPDDNIVVTVAEHHANFLPWQRLARQTGAELRLVNIDNDGQIDLDDLRKKLDHRTAVLTFAHVSNVLGVINPVERIIRIAKEVNSQILTVIDAAQSVSHLPVNVKEFDCDFLAFSGHKMYGPTGVGVLYGRKSQLEKLFPLLLGGEMVERVNTRSATFKDIPHRLEAGTPNIAGVIGLKAAVKFLQSIKMENIIRHDREVLSYARRRLRETFGEDIVFYGLERQNEDLSPHIGLLSFSLKGVHPHDLAEICNRREVALRAGLHCAQPLHRRLDASATARVSFGVYTLSSDIDRLIEAMQEAQKIFKSV